MTTEHVTVTEFDTAFC